MSTITHPNEACTHTEERFHTNSRLLSKKAAEKGRYVYMPTFWEVPEKFREICRDLRSFSFITKTMYLIKPQNKGILVGIEQGRQSRVLQGSSYKRSEAKCPRAALQGRHFPGQTPCALLVKSPGCYMGNQEEDIQPSISCTWFCPDVGFWFWLKVLHSFRALLSHCVEFYLCNLS